MFRDERLSAQGHIKVVYKFFFSEIVPFPSLRACVLLSLRWIYWHFCHSFYHYTCPLWIFWSLILLYHCCFLHVWHILMTSIVVLEFAFTRPSHLQIQSKPVTLQFKWRVIYCMKLSQVINQAFATMFWQLSMLPSSLYEISISNIKSFE